VDVVAGSVFSVNEEDVQSVDVIVALVGAVVVNVVVDDVVIVVNTVVVVVKTGGHCWISLFTAINTILIVV
jgi:hypothetical protein